MLYVLLWWPCAAEAGFWWQCWSEKGLATLFLCWLNKSGGTVWNVKMFGNAVVVRGPSLLEYLDSLPPMNRDTDAPVRTPVVDRYKVGDKILSSGWCIWEHEMDPLTPPHTYPCLCSLWMDQNDCQNGHTHWLCFNSACFWCAGHGNNNVGENRIGCRLLQPEIGTHAKQGQLLSVGKDWWWILVYRLASLQVVKQHHIVCFWSI